MIESGRFLNCPDVVLEAERLERVDASDEPAEGIDVAQPASAEYGSERLARDVLTSGLYIATRSDGA